MTISYKDIKMIKRIFEKELIFYEFNSYQVDEEGNISLEEFGKTVISYIQLNKIDKYLNHMESLQLKGKVNFQQFLSFQRIMNCIPRLIGRLH